MCSRHFTPRPPVKLRMPRRSRSDATAGDHPGQLFAVSRASDWSLALVAHDGNGFVMCVMSMSSVFPDLCASFRSSFPLFLLSQPLYVCLAISHHIPLDLLRS